MLREKRLEDDPIYSLTTRYDNGVFVGYYGPWYSSPLQVLDTIAYTNGQNRDNPCDHVAHHMLNAEGTYSWRDVNPRYTFTFSGDLRGAIGGYSEDWVPSESGIGDVNALVSQAYDEMKPTFRNRKFSLGNFLWELREMRKLYSPIIQVTKPLYKEWLRRRRAAERGWVYIPRLRRWGLVREIKTANDTFLSVRYGAYPFVGDIMALYNGWLTFSDRLHAFIAGQGLTQTRHFVKNFDDEEDVEDSGPTSTGVRQITTYTRKKKFHARMRFKYYLPQFSRRELVTRAFLDEFGIHPASVFYEAIPLSFVLDWFVPVGDWIKSRERDWLEPIVQLESLCYSTKETCKVSMQGGLQDAIGNAVVPVGSGESKWYRRSRGLPGPLRLQVDAEMTLNRIVSGTSLLLQRLL